MEKRFEESFKDLALIYETYYHAQKAGGQKDAMEGNPSYRKGAFSTPTGSVNQYQANQLSQTTAPVSDEEKEVNPIIAKIDELMKEAGDDGMDYAVHQLGTLKKFIEEA